MKYPCKEPKDPLFGVELDGTNWGKNVINTFFTQKKEVMKKDI